MVKKSCCLRDAWSRAERVACAGDSPVPSRCPLCRLLNSEWLHQTLLTFLHLLPLKSDRGGSLCQWPCSLVDRLPPSNILHFWTLMDFIYIGGIFHSRPVRFYAQSIYILNWLHDRVVGSGKVFTMFCSLSVVLSLNNGQSLCNMIMYRLVLKPVILRLSTQSRLIFYRLFIFVVPLQFNQERKHHSLLNRLEHE